jgi:lycopene cyclase domain-containing protein
MTYWGYHLLFTLPLIVLLGIWVRSRLRMAHLWCWLAVCLIVFVFTTPWDNYAVFLGIWGFGEGVSLGYPFAGMAYSAENPEGLSWLGLIPFEEYSFFILESTLVCLLLVKFLPIPGKVTAPE